MAASMRRAAAASTVARATPRVSVVCNAKGSAVEKVQIAAAAVAAAALLANPAQAGVVLQQPELKKVFQADDTPAAPVERPFRQPGQGPSFSLPSLPGAPAPAAKAEAPKPKKAEAAPSDGGIDPRAVALPGSIALIAGLGLVASKVDDGFSSWLNESGALVRNSGNFAGFEEELKGANYFATSATGTKKIGSKKGKK
eukprot:CAMPEP_0202860432 /NCGR_PEP_ID=MMETSP1391-20130828/2132_1 /ASSEMBLY_ACC=CAM_ASM_000867 /TAXON_ID=1034604 /ORGANISM="Chlamydomonas leiostraca, Strain SAG 11-49" /LENGTH=197 /DNA_ID=CAMNT_0049539591 /DNA_START=22 /DNA_END=615 /DNA_ORIENTATION=+